MIGREAPLAELARAAGLQAAAFESPAPLVIVYGGASTGKSVGVSQALREHAAPHALVDCTALYSAKEFYREALAQLRDGVASNEAEDATDSVTISVADERGKKRRSEAEDEDKFSSLNFLSFFKALDNFMVHHVALGDDRMRRVLYLALDHVDKLLDRGLGALLTCVCTINDQIAYLNMFDDSPPWEACVLLVTRGMSLDFDKLVMPFFPAYVHFPPYKPGQLADILVEQLGMKEANDMFRTWLIHLHGLLPPAPDGDWLEFRAAVVHLLPEFRDIFLQPVQDAQASRMKSKIERDTKSLVQAFLQTRRRHLFGYHKLGSSVGDPSELISCSNLSRNCLLLVLAGYLASFNPQETDVRFLSSSGGQRRKKRVKKDTASESSAPSSTTTSGSKKQQISQLLIGPRIFTLQRLLAIYLNLRVEAEADDESRSTETREEVFAHLATLVRMQLFQRTTPPHVLDNIKFRCLADARFVQETARYLSFPLDAYLNRAT
ncbi:Origin recognition complex subunit 5 [Phytophthora cinnamomi]|uniref:Origin recognition complex subunit 5 n=1 Tax=Phytophthora cinnamomi TaxID=4785 RepID=UPI0035594EA4|nr:Origin recognition complex subunit 5 [Phytophthora cinnamomi]